ncbi:MAG: phosphate/phosphite/phosphonate ABC transporter substrate-binding protein [Cognaticolwellia sp.]
MKVYIQYFLILSCICLVNIAKASTINKDAIQRTSEVDQEKTLIFGVVPQQSASILAQNWIPLIQYISNQTGIKIKFSTAPDIPTFEERLAQGDYDMAYMSPSQYTQAHEKVGFTVLVHERGKTLQGIVVANKDSKIDKLEDLSMQTIAFAAPSAFAATIIPQGELTLKNISFQSKYVNSHDAVYQNIAAGRFVAGGGIVRTYNALPDDIRQQLKIIWISEKFTPHAIATHPRIQEDIRQKLLQGFLRVDKASENKVLLAPLKKKGFSQGYDQDYNDVRDLAINSLLSQD